MRESSKRDAFIETQDGTTAKHATVKPGVVVRICNLSWEVTQKDCCEFGASLFDISSSQAIPEL